MIKYITVESLKRAEHIAIAAAVNSGRMITTKLIGADLHISDYRRKLAIVTIAKN